MADNKLALLAEQVKKDGGEAQRKLQAVKVGENLKAVDNQVKNIEKQGKLPKADLNKFLSETAGSLAKATAMAVQEIDNTIAKREIVKYKGEVAKQFMDVKKGGLPSIVKTLKSKTFSSDIIQGMMDRLSDMPEHLKNKAEGEISGYVGNEVLKLTSSSMSLLRQEQKAELAANGKIVKALGKNGATEDQLKKIAQNVDPDNVDRLVVQGKLGRIDGAVLNEDYTSVVAATKDKNREVRTHAFEKLPGLKKLMHDKVRNKIVKADTPTQLFGLLDKGEMIGDPVMVRLSSNIKKTFNSQIGNSVLIIPDEIVTDLQMLGLDEDEVDKTVQNLIRINNVYEGETVEKLTGTDFYDISEKDRENNFSSSVKTTDIALLADNIKQDPDNIMKHIKATTERAKVSGDTRKVIIPLVNQFLSSPKQEDNMLGSILAMTLSYGHMDTNDMNKNITFLRNNEENASKINSINVDSNERDMKFFGEAGFKVVDQAVRIEAARRVVASGTDVKDPDFKDKFISEHENMMDDRYDLLDKKGIFDIRKPPGAFNRVEFGALPNEEKNKTRAKIDAIEDMVGDEDQWENLDDTARVWLNDGADMYWQNEQGETVAYLEHPDGGRIKLHDRYGNSFGGTISSMSTKNSSPVNTKANELNKVFKSVAGGGKGIELLDSSKKKFAGIMNTPFKTKSGEMKKPLRVFEEALQKHNLPPVFINAISQTFVSEGIHLTPEKLKERAVTLKKTGQKVYVAGPGQISRALALKYPQHDRMTVEGSTNIMIEKWKEDIGRLLRQKDEKGPDKAEFNKLLKNGFSTSGLLNYLYKNYNGNGYYKQNTFIKSTKRIQSTGSTENQVYSFCKSAPILGGNAKQMFGNETSVSSKKRSSLVNQCSNAMAMQEVLRDIGISPERVRQQYESKITEVDLKKWLGIK